MDGVRGYGVEKEKREGKKEEGGGGGNTMDCMKRENRTKEGR